MRAVKDLYATHREPGAAIVAVLRIQERTAEAQAVRVGSISRT